MAVVKRVSSSAKDLTSTTQDKVPGELAEGHLKGLLGTVEWVNGDQAGSTVLLGYIPANARISPGAKVYLDAIAGNTKLRIGTDLDDACLMAETDVHLGGNFSAVGAVDISNYDKPLWKLSASYLADPGAHIPIYAKIQNDLGAGGTMTHDIPFKTV